MKKVLLAVGIVLMLSSLAGAQVLVTANTLGAGNWGYLGALNYDSVSTANSSSYGLGGFVAYGAMKDLDLYVKLGYGIASNLPAGITGSGLMAGVAAKYAFINESNSNPVSVAGLLGYQASTSTLSGLISAQAVEGDIGIGAIVSKIMVPWVPYGALVYHALTSNPGAVTGSNVEVAVGTQMLLSKSSAVVGEVSYNSISLGGSSTDMQVSLAYSAKI